MKDGERMSANSVINDDLQCVRKCWRSALAFTIQEKRFMADEKMVLHVEDNGDNRLLVRRLLQAYGYKVIEAENAGQARALVKEHTPDLILMDINMPDIDGYTLTNELKMLPNLFGVPIVAITANVMKGDRERTLSAGCDGYIEKPIDVDRFIEQVERFLE
jgi:two-component system, cell cycle response regulator DivK